MLKLMAVSSWRTLAMALAVVLAGCSTSQTAPPPLTVATEAARPTPSGPTPSLPLARAVAPSPSPVEASATSTVGFGPTLQLQSSAFALGGTMPADYTCDGADLSPPLSWIGEPPGTTAFTLVEQDLDTPTTGEPFTLWLIYNMPSRVKLLDAGIPAKLVLTNGGQQGHNDQQTVGYLGPCPNHGDPPHHYSLELFAQDAFVTLETGATIDAVRQALSGHTVGQAQLVVTFQR
jgi:Raf kinase inhibitor-like YbhB/YbcL family protein